MREGSATRARLRRRRARKTKQQHALSMAVVAVVVVLLLAVVGVGAHGLQERKLVLEQEIQGIEAQIEKEEARGKEIEEYAKEVQTKKFYEEYARDKLGLIYPNEKIFKKK